MEEHREQVKAVWGLGENVPKGRYRPRVQERLRKKESQKKPSGRMATEETYLKELEHI